MQHVLVAVVVVAALVVGGALVVFPPANHEPNRGRGCVANACLAELSNRDATRLLQLGWNQVNGDPPEEGALHFGGDDVFWIHVNNVNGTVSGDVVGYNFSARRLLSVGTNSDLNEIQAFPSAGRVIYLSEREPWASGIPEAGLMLWRGDTERSITLNADLPGRSVPFGFDGSWVVLRHTWRPGDPSNGLWAYHVDDHRLVQLRSSGTRSDLPEGATGGVQAAGVVGGVVYYAVNWNRSDDSVGMRLLEHDLQANVSRIVYDNQGDDRFAEGERWASRLTVSEKHVAWETTVDLQNRTTRVFLYNRATGATSLVDATGGRPNLGGDWLVYLRNHRDLVGLHIPTGQSVLLLEGGPTSDQSASEAATDGTRVVATIFRLTSSIYETTGQDVYWRMLPHI